MNIVKKYRRRNKKSYVLLFSILFLCTFLLTSLFVVKDSYDLYRINAAKGFYGVMTLNIRRMRIHKIKNIQIHT